MWRILELPHKHHWSWVEVILAITIMLLVLLNFLKCLEARNVVYEQVIKQIEAVMSENYIKFLPSTELKGLPNVMHDSETICGIACGLYSGRNGIIVATNERVFFFEKGRMWGSQLEEFRYENITSIQYKTGFIGGDITIFVAGNAAKIDMVPNDMCKPFVDAVQNVIGSRNAPATPATTDDDLLAKLERLAALKSAGMLTDEEFSAAKKKLLE